MAKLLCLILNQLVFIFGICFVVTWAAHMTIIQEGAEVRSYNKDIVENVTFFVERINKTMVTLNYNMSPKKDLVDTHMYIKYDGWTNGEWIRNEVIDFDFPFCDMYTDGDLNIFKPCMTDGTRGNFPDECPNDGTTLPKQTYFIRKCYLDESVRMQLFLPGRWRVNVDFFDGDGAEICHLYLYMNCIEVP